MTEAEELARKVSQEISAELFGAKILSNLTRPIFVERMLRHLLIGNWKHVGGDWAGWDLERDDGARLEVKQSAALQSWHHDDSSPTRGTFDIRRRDGHFVGSRWVPTQCRPADVYVFAWHGVIDRTIADHRNAEQWTFFVLPEALLPNQKTLALSRIVGDPRFIENDYLKVGAAVNAALASIVCLKAADAQPARPTV